MGGHRRYNTAMQRHLLPGTDLEIAPLCLGGNVFGWTADEAESFAVLDAYVAAGGNMIDTSDVYSAWVPGNAGGESESIIGKWMKARRNRDQLIIATKVGVWGPLFGLAPATIAAGINGSLARLGTGHVDLFYAHADDPATPLEETLRAFDQVVRAGKARYIAASNYGAARLEAALAVSRAGSLARFVTLQTTYSLVDRLPYEAELQGLCVREGMGCLPYYALASGFLTGKYQAGATVDSARREMVGSKYDHPLGRRALAAVEAIAASRGVPVAAVALAWVAAQPGIAAPIASARTPAQLAELLRFAEVALTAAELSALATASQAPGVAG